MELRASSEESVESMCELLSKSRTLGFMDAWMSTVANGPIHTFREIPERAINVHLDLIDISVLSRQCG